MASKKKPAPKKAAKPASKAKSARPSGGKAVAKKTVKKTTPPKKTAKPVPKKAAPVISRAARRPAPKNPPRPAAKQATPVKPAVPVKPVEKPTPVKKLSPNDPRSLVSIKPPVKPVIKKEPPKHGKIVIPKTTTKSSVKYEPEFTKSVLDTNPMYEHTGPTMRYSDTDLNEFREIIQKKLDAAKKELAYLQGLITRRDEGGDMDEARYMTMEDGSVSMEREQLSQMASRQITFIDHLEKAMMRIEHKPYGICRVTGKLIDKARLRAVPHATLSIEAKQMMNK
jgi:RNA polymerase-binding transcription factor DksA